MKRRGGEGGTTNGEDHGVLTRGLACGLCCSLLGCGVWRKQIKVHYILLLIIVLLLVVKLGGDANVGMR